MTTMRGKICRIGFTVGLAAVALAWFGAAAHAEDVDAILRRGNELRRQGRDREALSEFQRAARSEPSARTAAQIALAEQALGMWPEAEGHLSSALASGEDPFIRKNRAVLEKALATIHSHLCFVEVWGLPAGAVILVDGKRLGSLPSASAWLAPGEVSLQGKLDGYVPLRRTLVLPLAGTVREHVALRSTKEADAADDATSARPAPPRAAVPRTPVASAQGPEPAPPRAPVRELRRIPASDDLPARSGEPAAGGVIGHDSGGDGPAPESASSLRRSAKWIGWGAAVAGAGVGIYGVLQNRSLVASFDSRCAVDRDTGVPYPTAPGATDASCASSRRDYEAASRLALYGFVGAGVLAVIGTVFWLTEPAPAERRAALATCAPALGRDGAMFGCRMRF